MNGFDLSTISDLYIGGTQGSAIYLGSTKIWPKHNYSLDPFTIELLDADTLVLTTNQIAIGDFYYASYSLDNGQTWTTVRIIGGDATIGPLNAGQKVLLKSEAFNNKIMFSIKFNNNARCNVMGNLHSLIYGDNFIGTTSLPSGFGCSLFNNINLEPHVIDASNLIMPATTLTTYCYENMFRGCTYLTAAPTLPATTLVDYCYHGMFDSCTSLNYVKCLATDISATNCTWNWLINVASSGTFVKNASMNNWTTGYDGIPTNWTVQNAS